MTPNEFRETFLAVAALKNRPAEIESKRSILDRHLLPAVGTIPLDRIDERVVQDFALAQLKRYRRKTVNNQMSCLRRLLVTARKRGLILRVPEFDWLENERVDYDYLDRDESARLAASADYNWFAMIEFAQTTGLRLGELRALQWGLVLFGSRPKVRVRYSCWKGIVGPTKTGYDRDVPLCPRALRALERARARKKSPFVFHDDEGRMLTPGQCRWPLWRACDGAKLGRRIGWRVLRHSFASQLGMLGAPGRGVQMLLGHREPAMTERYTHVSDSFLREAVALLG